jgi:hypothetical protein
MRSAVASAMISAKDGGVVSNGYYSVYFAPGALEKDTEISIEMPEFPKAIVRLSPHGIQFYAPVILTLSLDAINAPADGYRVLWHNEVTGLWENVGGGVENGAITATLLHFSEYGPEPLTKAEP